jgi:hypothetical protein
VRVRRDRQATEASPGERARDLELLSLRDDPPEEPTSPDRHARTMLPIPDRPSFGLTTYDAKDPDTAYLPIEPLLPPGGAPNVLIVLLDDVGFGAASTFGGPCRTPRFESNRGSVTWLAHLKIMLSMSPPF